MKLRDYSLEAKQRTMNIFFHPTERSECIERMQGHSLYARWYVLCPDDFDILVMNFARHSYARARLVSEAISRSTECRGLRLE